MRRQIYLDVYPRLKGIEGIKWVDWDRGQFQNIDDPENFPLPAVLISLGDSHWSNRVEGVQEGVIDLNVDFYMHSYGDTTFEDDRNHATLASLEYLDKIYEALQFFQNDYVQSFQSCLRDRNWKYALRFGLQDFVQISGGGHPSTSTFPCPIGRRFVLFHLFNRNKLC